MEYKDAMDAYLIIEEVLELEEAIKLLDEIESPDYIEISGNGSGSFKSDKEELVIYIHKQTKLFLENKIAEQKELLTNIESNGQNTKNNVDSDPSI